jgi:hypothetical protein
VSGVFTAGVRSEIAQAAAVPVLVLCALLLAAVLAAAGRRTAALLTLPLAVAWVLFNGPVEGPTLLALTRTHGVTASDLVAVGAVAVAAVRLRSTGGAVRRAHR